jgi:hypothetical protein
MSVAKVIEIITESKKSWEDAADLAVKEASKTVRNVRTLYIEGMQAIIEDGKIAKYRLNSKITFIVE